MHPSPGVVLAVLLALLATQVARLLLHGRGPYLLSLALSVAGIVVGELVAGLGRFAGPSLGALHPVADLTAIAVLQAAHRLVAPSGGGAGHRR